MNLKSALRAIGHPGAGLPVEALRWLLDNWNVSSGAMTQILARCARDPENASDEDFIAGYFALHLLAEKRETRAFPLLSALARTPEGIPEMFGMALILSLSKIMTSLCGGDIGALREIMVSPNAEEDVRIAAFETLAWATADERISRAETHALLVEYADESDEKDADDACWLGWVVCVATLGFEDLRPRIEAIFAEEHIDPEELQMEDLEPIFALAREDPTGKTTLERDGTHPIDDAISHLSKVDAILAEMDADDEGGFEDAGVPDHEPGKPVINLNREVGRNDLCPCGSGKKYKKCCLAA